MSGGGFRGLVGRLGKLLGIAHDATPPPGASPPPIQLNMEALEKRLAGTKVRYSRARPSRTTRVDEVKRWLVTRQRLLVGIAGTMTVVAGAVYVARHSGERVIAREARGLWITDAPGYAGRRFELRGRVLAFQVDSAGQSTRHPVVRVRSLREGENGLRLQVTYLADDDPNVLDFVYRPGPPETIHLTNVPRVTWRRTTGRPLIPELP